MLHVAHVIPSIDGLAAGPSYSVSALCKSLSRRGAQVELHTLGAGDSPLGANATIYRHRTLSFGARLGVSPRMRRALLDRAPGLDVIHAHGLWRMPGLYAAHAAMRAPQCKFVVSPRGMLEAPALTFSTTQKRIFWAVGQGRALAEAHCLHATSVRELESIRSLGFLNPVCVVANGVDLPAQGRERKKTPRTLLYLGRIHRIKGLDRLLQAWQRVEPRFSDWTLRIVGPDDGGHLQELRALAAALHLERVTFAGPAYGAEKQAEFDKAHLYVLPSHSENFAMTVAEALGSGLPVLCSRGAPWRELEPHGCGIWTDNAPPALERALHDLLGATPETLASMGARGRAWMERDFAWDSKADEIAAVYAWLRDGGAPPASVHVVNAQPRAGNTLFGRIRAPW